MQPAPIAMLALSGVRRQSEAATALWIVWSSAFGRAWSSTDEAA